MPSLAVIIATLGVGQIFAWGSSYYLLAVLAKPITDDTRWPLAWVIGGVSLGLLVAGLVSPWVGRTIGRHGGRLVLASSTVLLAIGLGILGIAHTIAVYFVAWLIIGAGMGSGLYDPAFATLGRLYGEAARPAITKLTLFGGFSSTVCWPLSAFLVTHFGWRGTCFAYAAFHVTILLPLYLSVVPRGTERPREHVANAGSGSIRSVSRVASTRFFFGLLATAITLSAVISTLLSVHLLTILQSRGIDLAAAVALGALVGRLRSALARSSCSLRVTIIRSGRKSHRPFWWRLASEPCGHRCRCLQCRLSSTGQELGWSRLRGARSPSLYSPVRNMQRSWDGWRCRA